MPSHQDSKKFPFWFQALALVGLVVYGIWVQSRDARILEAQRQAASVASALQEAAVNEAHEKAEFVDDSASSESLKSSKSSDATDSKSPSKNAPIASDAQQSEAASASNSASSQASRPNRATADRNVISSRGPPTESSLGVLKDVGNRQFESTAGLRYGPGGAEGHRLDHLRRHDNDMPTRAGKHGVFDGDEHQMLVTIDEGWLMVKRNAPEVKATRDGERTAYDIKFGRRIGFLGGQEGQRQNNPPLQRMKLIVQGNDVITAYPY